MYRAAKKDITRKSLWHKGFQRFLMFFSLPPRGLNKTIGIIFCQPKKISLFFKGSLQSPCIMVVRKLSLFIP